MFGPDPSTVRRQPLARTTLKDNFFHFTLRRKAHGYIYNFNLSKERSIRTTFGLDPSTEGT